MTEENEVRSTAEDETREQSVDKDTEQTDFVPAENMVKEEAPSSETGEVSDDSSEEDAFFSKSFAMSSSLNEVESYDSAFAGGLRSVFEAQIDDEDETSTNGVEDISDAERIQRDLELERREALDVEIKQNDADFLYTAGSKYETPRASDADFDRDKGFEERRAIVRPESLLEAMLFVGDRENRPLSLKRACELIRDLSEMEALEILGDLNERYHHEGAPYRIVRDGDGYRLTLQNEFSDVLARFGGKTKEFKLSQTAVEILALVAYRQPITLDEILSMRANASGVLTQLVRRELISVEKQTVDKKRIAIYRTTDRFLKLFNLNSLDELPVIGDVDYR